MNFKNALVILGIVSTFLVAETDTLGIVETAKPDSMSSSTYEEPDTTEDHTAEKRPAEEEAPAGITVQEIPVDTVLEQDLTEPVPAEENESVGQLRNSMAQAGEDTVSLSDGTVLVGKVLETDTEGLVFLDGRTGRETVIAFERVRSITIGEGSSTITRKDPVVSETTREEEPETARAEEAETEVVFEENSQKTAPEGTSEVEHDPGRIVPRQQFALGPRLNFFHYDEKFPEEDVREMYGDVIIGEPKSTEYGPSFGFGFDGLLTGYDVPLQFRYGVRINLGLINTYDGSKIDAPIVVDDSIVGVRIESAEFHKNNYFFGGNIGFGWCGQFNNRLAVTIWSGVDARLWIRDLNELGSYNPEDFKEYYYWLNVPAVIESHLRTNPQFILGLVAGANLMVGGGMKASLTSSTSNDRIEYPAVVLGNKVGFLVGPMFIVTPSASVRIRIVPTVEFFGFGKSNTETAIYHSSYGGSESLGEFYEPASRTFWGGLDVSVVFTP